MIIHSGLREFPVADLTMKVHDDLGNEYTLGGGAGTMAPYGRSGEGWIRIFEPIHEETNTLTVTLSMTIIHWDLGEWQFDGNEESVSKEAIRAGGGSVEISEVVLGTIVIDIMRD